MSVRMMDVSEFDVDRERQIIEIAEELDCTIQRLDAISQPGTLMCHEALTLCGFLSSSVLRDLCDHPSILANSKWYIKARQIYEMITTLHAEIADQHLPGQRSEA